MNQNSKTKTEYVYLIGCRHTKTLKIGKSLNPKQRLATLQTSSPHRLTIIRSVKGGSDVEKLLHREFSHLRMKGEWFQWSQSIIDRFNTIAQLN